MSQQWYGAIEAGGTKFVCAVFDRLGKRLSHTRIATTTPGETLSATLAFFSEHREERGGQPLSFGIASFGPLDLNPDSPNFGQLLSTPKPGWSETSLITPFQQHFNNCPVAIDTDVNAAALAEARLGAGRNCDPVIYITVGTGIGGGIFTGGRTLKGNLHPEMGHMQMIRHSADKEFSGCCPFHGDCLEGLASGEAIKVRYGCSLNELPESHIAHELLAHYLGQFVANLILVLSPQRLILGGGVMQSKNLLQDTRMKAASVLNGYPDLKNASSMEQLIVMPGLGDEAGITGALLLAQALA